MEKKELIREFIKHVLNDEPKQEVDKDGNSLAACMLIMSDDGMILAVSRKDDPTDFGMPGGKVDRGETPAQAAIRELKEETGLDAKNVKKAFELHDGKNLVTTFIGEVDGEIETDEAGVIRWVKPSVLLKGKYALYNRALFDRLSIET